MRAANERLNSVSLVNVTAFAIYLFSVIGTFPLFFQLDEYRIETGIDDSFLVLKVLFYSSCNLVFFLIGVLFVRRIMGLRTIPQYQIEDIRITGFQKFAIFLAFLTCIAVLIYYLQKVEEIAIFAAISEGASAAMVARSEMGNSFSGNYHWYALVMQNIGSFLTFFAYCYWLVRRTKASFLFFIATFIYSAFVAVMAVEKAPLAWLIVGLLMTHVIARANGHVSFKLGLLLFFGVLTLLCLMSMVFSGYGKLGDVLWSVFSRAFSGSIAPAYFYLEFFPEHQEYLYGRTFPNPGGVFPYEPYLYTVEVMNWVFPWHIEQGVVGTAPTVFWGEAYANFGPIGVPLVAFFVGGVLAIISYLISRFQVNPISIAFSVWIILMFKDLSITGFSDFIFNFKFFILLFFVVSLLFLKGYIAFRQRVQYS